MVLLPLLLIVCVSTATVLPHRTRAVSAVERGVQQAQSLDSYCSFAVDPIYASSSIFEYGAPAAASIFMRMDAAPVATIDIAIARARTAMLFHNLPVNATQSTGELYDIQLTNGVVGTGGAGFLMSTGEAVGIACDIRTESDAKTMKAIAIALMNPEPHTETLESIPSPASVITLQQAKSIIKAIHSDSHTTPVTIAIVDRSANLKAMYVESGCPMGYAGAALSKARASVMFDLVDGSEGLQGGSVPGADAYGVQVTNGGLFTGMGGIALTRVADDSTQIYGAVGVAGSGFDTEAVAMDKTLAQLGAAAVDTTKMDPITLRLRRGVTTHEAQTAAKSVFEARAELEESSPGVVAVADAAGRVRAVYVEDGMERGALDIALKSATTAALFQISSADLGQYTQEGQPLYNVEFLFGGLVSFETAEPLYASDGSFIGAVGVSGTGAGKGTANDGYLAKVASTAVASYTDDCATATGYCATAIEPVVDVDLSYASPYTGEIVSLSQAVGLIQSITDYNQGIPQSSCNSVFDASDDAFVGALDLTGRKAKTAQLFRKVTNDELQDAQQPGALLYKIEVTNGGLFTNAGGASLFDTAGNVVGSVGVAGASTTGDAVVADVAISAWDAVM